VYTAKSYSSQQYRQELVITLFIVLTPRLVDGEGGLSLVYEVLRVEPAILPFFTIFPIHSVNYFA
jgi:hypothetical protein